MMQSKLFQNEVPIAIAVVLGAGASRGVSYSDLGGIQSPLDSDFFDLLQRLDAAGADREAVKSVIKDVGKMPYECWRSMERAFYTLHLRAYMRAMLENEKDDDSRPDERVIKDFAQCVQALLRKAHGKQVCKHHQRLCKPLHEADTILSFNYDLVPERAIRSHAESRDIALEEWLYGLKSNPARLDLPLILKLHGSSNWKLKKTRATEKIEVLTEGWAKLDSAPGYRGHVGQGSDFPIFLPFWEKRIERGPWLRIWRKAFERLKEAEAVLVWGYSLPTTDVKAQHLFSLSLSDKPIRLSVIDPSPDTRRRWRELLPRAHFFPYDSIEHFFSAPPSWWRSREDRLEGS